MILYCHMGYSQNLATGPRYDTTNLGFKSDRGVEFSIQRKAAGPGCTHIPTRNEVSMTRYDPTSHNCNGRCIEPEHALASKGAWSA